MLSPPVLIEWVDISSFDGSWMEMSDARQYKPLTVKTCGWVVVETSEYITLVSSVSDDEETTGSVNSIPKGCVVSVTALGCVP